MDKENILYYQSNIKTSRNEDSVYAMKYASQQMLIDKLEQQCKKQKEVIDKAVKYIDDLRDESAERQGFYNCFPDDLYIPDINKLLDILNEVTNNE